MPVRIDANMKIQVVVYSTTSVSVNVAYRESINGEMRQPRQANIVSSRITTDAAANYFYFTMAGTPTNPSELQNVVVGLATANVQRGQCFVRVGITIGGTDGTASDPIEVLFSDYVTSSSFLAYPGTGINSSLDGRGYIYPLQVAGGTGPQSVSYGLNKVVSVYNITFSFVASVAVATRKVFVKATNIDAPNGNNIIYPNGITVTAGNSKIFYFQNQPIEVREETLGGVNYVQCFIPNNLIVTDNGSAYGTIEINADGLDAADQITEIVVLAEQWIKA